MPRLRVARPNVTADGAAPCYDNCAPCEVDAYFSIVDAGGIVYTQCSGNNQPVWNGYNKQVIFPFYGGFYPTPLSSVYWISAQKAAIRCVNEEAAAALHAYNMARYIISNAGAFAANVSASANAALKRWGPTGFAVSAAADFIAGVIAEVTIAQWFFLSAGVVISAAFAVALWRCYAGITS